MNKLTLSRQNKQIRPYLMTSAPHFATLTTPHPNIERNKLSARFLHLLFQVNNNANIKLH